MNYCNTNDVQKLKNGVIMMKSFKVGFSQVNANPPLGIGVGGYFIPRFAKGFIDDIEVKALVLELGQKQIAMISLLGPIV